MKLSTAISASAFLLVASSADADNNNVRNLKKRVLEDTMSMPATEEASDPDKQHWWPYKPDPPSPAPGCNGIPTTTCEGFEYLKLVTGASLGDSRSRIPWHFFYENAPDGCVLAPINTAEDLLKAQAAVAPVEAQAWVGLFKEAVDVCGGALLGDCTTSSSSAVNENNWKNLDGTYSVVANSPYTGAGNSRSNVWTGNEPNNSPPVQQYAHIRGDSTGKYLLRDLNDQNNSGPAVDAAVYKCCGSTPVLTFPDCEA